MTDCGSLEHTANKVDLALIYWVLLTIPFGYTWLLRSRYVGDIISRVRENRKIQRAAPVKHCQSLLGATGVYIYGD